MLFGTRYCVNWDGGRPDWYNIQSGLPDSDRQAHLSLCGFALGFKGPGSIIRIKGGMDAEKYRDNLKNTMRLMHSVLRTVH